MSPVTLPFWLLLVIIGFAVGGLVSLVLTLETHWSNSRTMRALSRLDSRQLAAKELEDLSRRFTVPGDAQTGSDDPHGPYGDRSQDFYQGRHEAAVALRTRAIELRRDRELP